ncbi:YoaK family protein [Herbiconiux sp. SYSU D00978]|uniref:YoaK family protein n=1 Tax=Herbiconiux sp. SYSU D00978 TaxID=2812562 RepID=UPI001A969C71|nr:YoaK family protein [Herbiconiux sp. SYSU D00978]
MTLTRRERWYVLGLLLLTASTGAIDAVSYLALDRVFTGNMTGNVLFLGFALVGVADIPFLNNAVALLGFVAGSILGGRLVGRGHAKALPHRSGWVLAVSAATGFGLTIVWLALGELPEPVLLLVTFLLAAMMGAQVAAVKPLGNTDITTVVVTNTLANLARESRLGGGKGQAWVQRLLAVIAMGVGAAVGAAVVVVAGGAWALGASLLIFLAGGLTLALASRGARVVKKESVVA